LSSAVYTAVNGDLVSTRSCTERHNNNGLLYIAAQCWIIHKTLKH